MKKKLQKAYEQAKDGWKRSFKMKQKLQKAVEQAKDWLYWHSTVRVLLKLIPTIWLACYAVSVAASFKVAWAVFATAVTGLVVVCAILLDEVN